MKKPALLITILVLTVFVLSIVRIYVSNRIATSGVVLGVMQEKIDSLKVENNLLSERLFEYSSLTNIASKAYHLGYEDEKSEYVLSQQVPVAIKQ